MSWVDGIDVTNFRGIARCKIDDFAQLNVLIGRNNCGKSSLLEALTRTFCTGSDLENLNKEVRGESIADLWAISRNEWESDRTLRVRSRVTSWSDEIVKKRADKASVSIHGAVQNWAWSLTPGGVPTPTQISAQRSQRVGLFLPADVNNKEIERKLWRQVFGLRGDKRIVEHLRDAFEHMPIEALNMAGETLMLGFPKEGVSIDGQGLGVRAAVRMMILAELSSSGGLVIEEPECHLHPSALRPLAKALTAQAMSGNIQLFITTHSAECVRAFAEAAAETRGETNTWAFAAWFLGRDADGIVKPTKLTKETVLDLDAGGTDVRCLDEFR